MKDELTEEEKEEILKLLDQKIRELQKEAKDIIELEKQKKKINKYKHLKINNSEYFLALRKGFFRWNVELWLIGKGNKLWIDDDGKSYKVTRKQKISFNSYEEAKNYFNNLVEKHKEGVIE